MNPDDGWTEVVSSRTKNDIRKREKNIEQLTQTMQTKGRNCIVVQLPLIVCKNETYESGLLGKVIGRQGANVKNIIAETSVDNIHYDKKNKSFVVSSSMDNPNTDSLTKAKDILVDIIDTYVVSTVNG